MLSDGNAGSGVKRTLMSAPPPGRSPPRPSRRAPPRPGGRSRARGPEPGIAAGVVGAVEALEDVRQVGGVEPGPWSRTVSVPPCSPSSTTLPGGLHLIALSSRLETARLMRSGSPRTTVGSSVDDELRRRRRCGASARSHERRDDAVDADVVQDAAGLAAARELDHVADEGGQLVELDEDVRAQRGSLVLAGRRSRSSSVWMFARRLAIGVRSSWLASATRWRCASTERSSASRVALKLRARRASSSSPVDGDPLAGRGRRRSPRCGA